MFWHGCLFYNRPRSDSNTVFTWLNAAPLIVTALEHASSGCQFWIVATLIFDTKVIIVAAKVIVAAAFNQANSVCHKHSVIIDIPHAYGVMLGIISKSGAEPQIQHWISGNYKCGVHSFLDWYSIIEQSLCSEILYVLIEKSIQLQGCRTEE